MADFVNPVSPQSVDTTTAGTNGLPAWYQQYLQNIAGSGVSLANSQANMDLPAQSVAGFNSDQLQSMAQVRDAQGNWQPYIGAATDVATQMTPGATQYAQGAQNAVAGPAQSWDTAAASKYMSPYTSNVIDNIQRLGLRNFNENLMPAVNSSFIGAGQFGSTRNADILGRTARDVNDDITGQIANALQGGYTNAQTAFTSDANRQQQQQQMQGSAAIQGGNLVNGAMQNQVQALGALGQSTAGLALNDAQALNAVGGQQQQQQQAGLNASYNNANAANNFDWTNLNNLNSIVHGLQLPANPTQTTNLPMTNNMTAGASPISQIGTAIGALGKTF